MTNRMSNGRAIRDDSCLAKLISLFLRYAIATVLLALNSAGAYAQTCVAPLCWPGKFYKFEVMAQTGQVTSAGTLTGFGTQPSVNENGVVAFVGQIGASNFSGVFANAGVGSPTWISTGFGSSGRTFDSAVQINDLNQIIARDSIPGSPPPSLLRIWDGNNPGNWTLVARGGNATDPFASVFTQPAINFSSEFVFSACDQNCDTLLATPSFILVPPFNEVYLNTPLRPMIDDHGNVVTQNGGGSTNPIVEYDNNLDSFSMLTIGDTSSDFSTVGMSPGVSRDGVVVAFSGDMTATGATKWGTNPGPGVFIAILQTSAVAKIVRIAGFAASAAPAPAGAAPVACTPGTAALGYKCVEQVGGQGAFPPPAGTNWDGYCDPGEFCIAVGELEDIPPAVAGGASTPAYFTTFDPANFATSSAEWNQRIGVTHTDYGAPGLDGDTVVVSFVATPNVASGLNIFTAQSGLWTVQVDLALQGATILPKVHKAIPVLAVGDLVGSATTTVTAVSVYDPIANANIDELGKARTTTPGDHEVSFWVSTSTGGQMILRGTHEDTDGDGLLDHWEEYGIDFNGDGIVDLNLATLDPANPPNPKHKDLYVEADYFCTGAVAAGVCTLSPGTHTHQPGIQPYTGNALNVPVGPIAQVIAAFNNSPVTNPDGTTGINLHVQVDEAIAEIPIIIWNGPVATAGSFQSFKAGTGPCGGGAGVGHFGTVAERADANCVNIIGARTLAVRYTIFGQDYSMASTPAVSTASSGVAKIRGNDFLVTLSVNPKLPNPCTGTDFANWAQCIATTWGTSFDTEWADLQAGTFMHEGGHTLGLFHGGNDLFANYKPNFISIMNYSFQFNTAGNATFNMPITADCRVLQGSQQCRTNRTMNYSAAPALASLNEAALIEANGIGGPAGGRTVWYLPDGAGGFVTFIGLTTGPLDWNFNGAIDPNPIALDINQSGGLNVLTGNDDWSRITYGFYNSPLLSLGAQVSEPAVAEPTLTDYINATLPAPAVSAPPVKVPNVVGLTQAAATSAITGAGLTLGTVTPASSSTVASGNVISESPVAGTSVKAGSAVNLTVSTGPAPVTVPNVVGLTQAAATSAITGAGLTLGTVSTASSSTVALGNVISESPVAGTSVASGSAVNLTVSTGPAPVTVPNVVGLTQAAATSAITGAGLTRRHGEYGEQLDSSLGQRDQREPRRGHECEGWLGGEPHGEHRSSAGDGAERGGTHAGSGNQRDHGSRPHARHGNAPRAARR